MHHYSGVIHALMAAVLFGAGTPFAKVLLSQVSPIMLAGLLYAGSGIGLTVWFVVRLIAARRSQNNEAAAGRLTRTDLPWLAGAILAGGIAGPILLMVGLAHTQASAAALLLNMEGVLTALLAWFVFKENFDRRIFIGMAFIVAAGVLLSWEQTPTIGVPWGAAAIIAACFCWAIDNNLTRKVSASDAVQIAGTKGLVAGVVNLTIAFSLGGAIPALGTILIAGLVGFCSYGLSLVFFVLALRHLGTARTGAYFSVAPFAGAVIAILMLGEHPSVIFWIATVLMGVGIWLHLSESHSHNHTHLPLAHAHSHSHDTHHQHEHAFAWDNAIAHSHAHEHQPLSHTHAHYPDIHHQHMHESKH